MRGPWQDNRRACVGGKRGCYNWLTDGWKRSGIEWLGLVSSPHSAFSCKFEGSENGAPAENASAWRNLVIKLINWCYLLLNSVAFWHQTVLKVIKLSDCHTLFVPLPCSTASKLNQIQCQWGKNKTKIGVEMKRRVGERTVYIYVHVL